LTGGNRLLFLVDTRESRCNVPALLAHAGFVVKFRELSVGDYVLPGNCLVERKTAADLISSLFDGRLMKQLETLSSSSEAPTLVVESSLAEELKRTRNPNAVWGALATATYSMGIHLFFTQSEGETAQLLSVVARHGRYRRPGYAHLRALPKGGTQADQQLRVVSSLPTVGPRSAIALLKYFGTVRNIFTASESQLAQTPGLGMKRVTRIRSLLDARYTDVD